MRRLPIIGLILTLVGLLSSTVVAAGPQPDRHKRAAGRRPTIDLLRADRAQLTLQLRAMNVAVRHQWIRLAKADHDEARARHAAARIRARVASKEAELRTLRRRVKDMVVRSYVNGTDVSDVALLTSAEGTDARRAHALLEVSSAQEANLVRQLRRVQADLIAARRQADGALTTARRRRRARRLVVDQLTNALAGQQRLARAVDQRLRAAVVEAVALASRRAAQSRPLPAPGTVTPAAPASPPSAAIRRVAGGGSIALAEVKGIVVSAAIASQLAALLAAAEAAGISLGGGGYRDSSQQIGVRRSNCGTSHYAIYRMPPSSCSPTTALPGTSMHEQGIAIDFTVNGSSISGRSTPAFRWLAANAGRFGFHNLPSEPWHWSINGR